VRVRTAAHDFQHERARLPYSARVRSGTVHAGARVSSPERAWSTAPLPAHEQFACWSEIATEAFVPVSLQRFRTGPFPSAVSGRAVGAIGVSVISSQAQSVARTAAHVERRPGDVFFLNLPLTEGSSAAQSGRRAPLRRGDFAIVDSARPFELEFAREFRQISLALPHEALAPLLAAPGEATAARVRGDRGVGAVAAGAVRALASAGGAFDRESARAVSDHVLGLIALSLGGLRAPPRSAGRALLAQAAIDEVERSLADPGLAPASIAARLSISVRYLHALFADRGVSFGRWVLARRLERCRSDLEDRGRAHWTVAEIALHNGFADPSYLARAFRARYGVSPRELRAAALSARTGGDARSRGRPGPR
jgi:AraC family transcriptional regulator, positive regulator of tynA and feaB